MVNEYGNSEDWKLSQEYKKSKKKKIGLLWNEEILRRMDVVGVK